MGAGLANSIRFDPADPRASLAALPEAPGVFALCAADPTAEPYLSKTPNLRRRLMRFLRGPQTASEPGQDAPPPTRRLQLAHMVDHIEYTVTGSEFESSLCLYDASLRAFGGRAQRRMRLRPPTFLRMSVDNPYPRVYVTTKISKAASNALFGPFPSRAAAERFADEMLNLFLLRRCTEDLNPDPAFPGCVYSEMKMCLAPCYKGCSDERYRQESAEVFAFLSTRGASMLSKLEMERNAASEAMAFERAAALHQRMQKVQGVAHLASEAVHPLAQLTGILVQPSAEPGHVALFALRRGVWNGPASYSIVGMRLANERSGSSSLFAHPFALEAVPLEGSPLLPAAGQPAKDRLESRLEEALTVLTGSALKSVPSQTLCDHLALFTQWFYRPAARSGGEIVFAGTDGEVARKPLLRAISRVAARANSANPEELEKPPIQWHA
jgi:excinuclease ABC subunit C